MRGYLSTGGIIHLHDSNQNNLHINNCSVCRSPNKIGTLYSFVNLATTESWARLGISARHGSLQARAVLHAGCRRCWLLTVYQFTAARYGLNIIILLVAAGILVAARGYMSGLEFIPSAKPINSAGEVR